MAEPLSVSDELLINSLKPLGYPVRLQGSLLSEENYPDNFFTYWNDDSSGSGFYDNEEHAEVWLYSLNFYSINPKLIKPTLRQAKTLLKSCGFIVTGNGHNVMSDEPTHTGRGINLTYRENGG